MKTGNSRGVAALLLGLPFASLRAEHTATHRRRDQRGNRGHGAEARLVDPGSAVLRGRGDGPGHQGIGCHQHRRGRAQCAGPVRHGSGAGPEPGRHPRHQRRPGGARPGRREGVGRNLSGRVADLGGLVHSGSRSLRPGSHRSAARPAGHVVRCRFELGHGAVHHRAADPREVRRLGRGGRRRSHGRRLGWLAARRAECAAGRERRHARRGLLQRPAGIHRFGVSEPRHA